MFIKLSHKIKKVIVKNWKIDLCLVGMAFFALLTAFVYSMPNTAKNVFLVLLCFGLFLACIGLTILDNEDLSDIGMVFSVLGIIVLILAFVLLIELVIFKGWEWL